MTRKLRYGNETAKPGSAPTNAPAGRTLRALAFWGSLTLPALGVAACQQQPTQQVQQKPSVHKLKTSPSSQKAPASQKASSQPASAPASAPASQKASDEDAAFNAVSTLRGECKSAESGQVLRLGEGIRIKNGPEAVIQMKTPWGAAVSTRVNGAEVKLDAPNYGDMFGLIGPSMGSANGTPKIRQERVVLLCPKADQPADADKVKVASSMSHVLMGEILVTSKADPEQRKVDKLRRDLQKLKDMFKNLPEGLDKATVSRLKQEIERLEKALGPAPGPQPGQKAKPAAPKAAKPKPEQKAPDPLDALRGLTDDIPNARPLGLGIAPRVKAPGMGTVGKPRAAPSTTKAPKPEDPKKQKRGWSQED